MNISSDVCIVLKRVSLSCLGSSYLFEVQNEVHNNSSLEIYYQVHLYAKLMFCVSLGKRRGMGGGGGGGQETNDIASLLAFKGLLLVQICCELFPVSEVPAPIFSFTLVPLHPVPCIPSAPFTLELPVQVFSSPCVTIDLL